MCVRWRLCCVTGNPGLPGNTSCLKNKHTKKKQKKKRKKKDLQWNAQKLKERHCMDSWKSLRSRKAAACRIVLPKPSRTVEKLCWLDFTELSRLQHPVVQMYPFVLWSNFFSSFAGMKFSKVEVTFWIRNVSYRVAWRFTSNTDAQRVRSLCPVW